MATANVRVMGHFADSNGKALPHLGTGLQFVMSVSILSSGYPDPAAINTVFSNNAKYRGVATQFIVTSYANLDKEHNPNGILT